MTKTNRLLVVFNTLLATILVLVLVQFAPSIANADSSTIVACANKKTGALRIAYKKCSKEENNVTWGITGPQGAAGPQGASGQVVVRDANGNLVSGAIDIDGHEQTFYRLTEDGVWNFRLDNGALYRDDDSVDGYLLFQNESCTGSSLFGIPDFRVTTGSGYPGGSQIRLNVPKLGASQYGYYKYSSSTYVSTAGYTHLIGYDNTCRPLDQFDNYTFGLPVTEVVPPAPLPGPLTISAS